MNKLLILNYHAIAEDVHKDIPVANAIYEVNKSNFIAQLELLKKHNIEVCSLADLNKVELPAFSVAITFDDGNSSDYSVAFPLLKEYGFAASFFPVVASINNHNLTEEQLIELSENNFTIGSHGFRHIDLTTLSVDDQLKEFTNSKRTLEEKIGKQVTLFSAPFGKINKKSVSLARESGYSQILTTNFKLNNANPSPFVLHRWSVKKSTSLTEFENIIQNNSFTIGWKTIESQIKRWVILFIGSAAANRLNIFIHKKQKKA